MTGRPPVTAGPRSAPTANGLHPVPEHLTEDWLSEAAGYTLAGWDTVLPPRDD